MLGLFVGLKDIELAIEQKYGIDNIESEDINIDNSLSEVEEEVNILNNDEGIESKSDVDDGSAYTINDNELDLDCNEEIDIIQVNEQSVDNVFVGDTDDNDDIDTVKNIQKEDTINKSREQELELKIAELERRLSMVVKTDTNSGEDGLKNRQKNEVKEDKYNIELYSSMDMVELYKEVEQYLILNNVKVSPVPRLKLEEKFGKKNIARLIMRGYLIHLGNGITMGRRGV